VLAYNIVLMAGLALTGWTTSLVVARWTGSRLAGILSGSLMAFNAFTLTRFAEIQDQHLEFFPLALMALDRVLTTPRVTYAVQLAGWFVLQALTCGYLLAFGSLSLVAGAAVRASEWMTAHTDRLRVTKLLALSAVVAVVALTPFLLPYLRVSREHGFTRPLDEVALYSARATDYLATGGRLHFRSWSHRFFDREALFPGVIALCLAVVALAGGVWRDRRARMAIAFGVVAFALSFGPTFPLYGATSTLFPLMAGIRGASRFGQFVLAAVAILAGFGLARLQGRLTRVATVIGIVLVAGVHVEALRAPINYRAFGGISPIFDNLRDVDHALVACFPLPPPVEAFHNVDCMLASTRFWKPLVNGYSSFMPERYSRSAAALDAFPDGDTLPYLRQLGVTHVVVFTDKVSAPRQAKVAAHPGLLLWQADASARIYLVK
jgi:hypothetical protein